MSTTDDHSPGDAADSSATGLWQFITMDISDAQAAGEIRMHAMPQHVCETIERSMARWREMRTQTAARIIRRGSRAENDAIATGDPGLYSEPETAVHRIEAFRRAYGIDPARVLNGALDRIDRANLEAIAGRSVTFECAMPPYTQETREPLTYDALADFCRAIGGSTTTLSEDPSMEELAEKVAALRAEVRAMDLALDSGAEQCAYCESFETTWAPATQQWLCSDCADRPVTAQTHEMAESDLERFLRDNGIPVYDYQRAFLRLLGTPTTEMHRPREASEASEISREQFVRDYWRAGQYVVNPADHIRITGIS